MLQVASPFVSVAQMREVRRAGRFAYPGNPSPSRTKPGFRFRPGHAAHRGPLSPLVLARLLRKVRRGVPTFDWQMGMRKRDLRRMLRAPSLPLEPAPPAQRWPNRRRRFLGGVLKGNVIRGVLR